MWVVIPAAGRGTRLRSASGGTPKILLEVQARPLLGHLLERLGDRVSAACVVVGDAQGTVARFLRGREYGIPIHTAVQPEPRGVGDAILAAAGKVKGPFVTVMGDVYYDRPLLPYVDEWRRSDADGAVLVEPLGRTITHPVGLVSAEGEMVTRIDKGDRAEDATHAVCGMAILPEEVFDVPLHPGPSGELELEDLVRWLIEERGMRFRTLRYEGWRRNINTPADLRAVRRRVAHG